MKRSRFGMGKSARHDRWPIRRLSIYLISAVLFGGCQTAPPGGVITRSSPAEPSAVPGTPPEGATHYVVTPDLTDVRILVYRGGPLARFGHNHVISAREATGDVYLAGDFSRSSLALSLPVLAMEVDPSSARAEEGAEFASAVSPEAIEATRSNMLGEDVLDAENHPEISIRSVAIVGPPWGPDITIQVTLRGATVESTIPVAIAHDDRRLTATGVLELQQTDFGLTPFTALGGGLQVQDRLKIRFRIVADRIDD